MTVTSTIPGAVSTLQGYMNTVASANASLNAGVYVGLPVEYVTNNYMQIGSYEEGVLVAPGSKSSWAAIPGQSKLRYEEYAIQGCVRAWDGNVDPTSRLNDAFTMLNGIHAQILADIGGSGNLSPSGSWGDLDWTVEASGALNASGWGVVIGFELHVINVQLTG